jgi:hypothetical protein
MDGECHDQDGYEVTQSSQMTSLTSGNHQAVSIYTTGRGKHRREASDDEQDEREGEGPKRPRPRLLLADGSKAGLKFACPYRKRNPRKYCVTDWRSCTLTPLDTIARLK